MSVGLVLWRREFLRLRRLLGEGVWLLLYGRRKTGKTFMARLLVPWRLYATVARDRTVVVEEPGGEPHTVEPEEAARLVVRVLRRGGVAVVDEFQRLPDSLWQMLVTAHPSGVLVLVASSLGVVERVFSTRSPLLGLVAAENIGILRFADTVASLLPRLGPRGAVLWGLVLREPWTAEMPGVLQGTPWDWAAGNARLLYQVARSLVGEVFEEEERRLTRLYEAVLRLLGAGVWDSAALAGILHRRGLVSAPSASTVTGVLDKLADMGLVARTRLWRTRGRRVYYRHASPLLGIVFGLAEKYAVDEHPAPPEALRGEALALYARELQFTLAELLAEHHGGVAAYTILPRGEGDVDIVVLDARGRRALAAYEVKLGKCTRRDYAKAAQRAAAAGADEAGIICLGGATPPPSSGLRALGPEDIAALAVEAARKTLPGTPAA